MNAKVFFVDHLDELDVGSVVVLAAVLAAGQSAKFRLSLLQLLRGTPVPHGLGPRRRVGSRHLSLPADGPTVRSHRRSKRRNPPGKLRQDPKKNERLLVPL